MIELFTNSKCCNEEYFLSSTISTEFLTVFISSEKFVSSYHTCSLVCILMTTVDYHVYVNDSFFMYFCCLLVLMFYVPVKLSSHVRTFFCLAVLKQY